MSSVAFYYLDNCLWCVLCVPHHKPMSFHEKKHTQANKQKQRRVISVGKSFRHVVSVVDDNDDSGGGAASDDNDDDDDSCRLSDADVGVLKQQLREKDAKLTDIRLEALSSAHQLEQLRETMMKMKVGGRCAISIIIILSTEGKTILHMNTPACVHIAWRHTVTLMWMHMVLHLHAHTLTHTHACMYAHMYTNTLEHLHVDRFPAVLLSQNQTLPVFLFFGSLYWLDLHVNAHMYVFACVFARACVRVCVWLRERVRERERETEKERKRGGGEGGGRGGGECGCMYSCVCVFVCSVCVHVKKREFKWQYEGMRTQMHMEHRQKSCLCIHGIHRHWCTCVSAYRMKWVPWKRTMTGFTSWCHPVAPSTFLKLP